MRKLTFLVIGLLFTVSCKEQRSTDALKQDKLAVEMPNESEIVLQKLLDLPKLQWVFHPEIAERLPIKILKNEFVPDSLKLLKFDENVRIAALPSFQKENIQDYILIKDLNIKKDTARFDLDYEIEGVSAKGTFIKISSEWVVQDYTISESSIKQEKPTKTKNSIRTLAYKGADLGYLANRYYGNKAYRHVISAYNSFEDKRSLDKNQDSIRIPTLSLLSKDNSLPRLKSITKELEKAIQARISYLKQEKKLWSLSKDPENRNFRNVSQTQKSALLGASKLMYECVSGLEQQKKPPKKAIGQFRQVAKNLEHIANGKIDENGYAIDMVHQRLAHGLANCLRWAKEE